MAQYPTGGGHYSVIIGYNDTGWWVHDPNGEADLIHGGYVSNSIHAGVAVKYSYKNWNPRWIVEGEGSGWMMDIWDPATKTPVTTTDKQKTAEPGLDLIKHFEGCRLLPTPTLVLVVIPGLLVTDIPVQTSTQVCRSHKQRQTTC